ncbi:MAG TPA: BTAD domain-containing putative transcriptional regulator, partial [Mycobacteriales bacterium]|nr:BTAD domain-containing putative transcriptional regulator [Mycobacteriales bacterium]
TTSPTASPSTGGSASSRAAPAADLGPVEILTAADAADLLTGLLPAVRDTLNPPGTLPPQPEPSAISSVDAQHPSISSIPDGDSTAERSGPNADAQGTNVRPHDRNPRPLPAGAVLAVNVFGHPRVQDAGGRDITGLRAKARDLLALLAVHPDGLTAEQVGDALWPDAPPGRATARLSPTLAYTRRALREATVVTGTNVAGVDLVPMVDGRYRLDPGLVDTDYRRFTAALADYAGASAAGDDTARRDALARVADAYGGEALDGIPYLWAEPVRESTRRQAADTLATLAELCSASGDAAPALAALERAVEVDPYAEELYRRIMRLHAAAGRTGAVRRTLRLLEARLVDLDTDPDPATLTLAADLLRPRTQSTRQPDAVRAAAADHDPGSRRTADAAGADRSATD